MHRILLSAFLWLFCICGIPKVQGQGSITFAGGTLQSDSLSVSFSAGEVVSGTFNNSSIQLTTGFSNGGDNVFVSNERLADDIPATFRLKQNYPNPFNPSTNIAYDLPEKADVRLEVFNIIGAKVATLVQKQKPAGSHVARFDAASLASGMYLYRLTANGNLISTKKMILIK
ncbi:T9SS type A sorting domain-containing protein [Gracilimonas sp.]|uniref:T9SS type A sorting domain-containing protein n=1 Tax=Gracilimonas sp. TaxID=1974203 RepID=UPI003BA8ED4E